MENECCGTVGEHYLYCPIYGLISQEWYLGDDDDCENCGYSNNQLVFEETEDGGYQLGTRLYCYGGNIYFIDALDTLFDEISGFEHYDEIMKKEIIAIVEKYKQKHEVLP